MSPFSCCALTRAKVTVIRDHVKIRFFEWQTLHGGARAMRVCCVEDGSLLGRTTVTHGRRIVLPCGDPRRPLHAETDGVPDRVVPGVAPTRG